MGLITVGSEDEVRASTLTLENQLYLINACFIRYIHGTRLLTLVKEKMQSKKKKKYCLIYQWLILYGLVM